MAWLKLGLSLCKSHPMELKACVDIKAGLLNPLQSGSRANVALGKLQRSMWNTWDHPTNEIRAIAKELFELLLAVYTRFVENTDPQADPNE